MSCDLPPVCGPSVQFEPGMAGYGRPYLPDTIELRPGHRSANGAWTFPRPPCDCALRMPIKTYDLDRSRGPHPHNRRTFQNPLSLNPTHAKAPSVGGNRDESPCSPDGLPGPLPTLLG